MAFINPGGTGVIAFAEASDVEDMDQRVFEANEGFTDDIIELLTEKATNRILTLIKDSDWWRGYYIKQSGASFNATIYNSSRISVPAPDPNKIRARQSDFTDLCVFYTLKEYIYPKVADFSTEDNSERAKIGFYDEKFRRRFQELLDAGDWYDFDNTGVVTDSEKNSSRTNLVRIR